MDFKNINIGELISLKVKEDNIQIDRIQNFFKCEHHDILKMYQSKSLDSEILLKWCKLLKYDFFRLYSHHLILYAIPDGMNYVKKSDTKLPQFRKHIYTKEIINFIVELINTNQKSANQVINDYKIPKTTLYRWLSKYNK